MFLSEISFFSCRFEAAKNTVITSIVGATAFTHAKAPAVLPTIGFA